MKKSTRYFLLAMIVVLGITKISLAAAYYLSSSGSDSNNGTSLSTPWKTISYLNTKIGSFTSGTVVYFKKGDVFSGQINLSVNGSTGNKIKFDSYGSGALPILTGNITVGNWVVHNGNIWKTQVTSGAVKQLFLNKQRLQIARYPDTGFFRIDNGGSTTTFTDAAINQPNGYFVGANVVMHTINWAWEYCMVTNSTSTGVITYSISKYPPDNDVGYFFTNKLDFISMNNEWYFDSNSSTLYLYSTSNPNNQSISATIYDYAIKGSNGRKDISINNIGFEGQDIAAIAMDGSSFININKCNFNNQNKNGIDIMGDSISIKNCYFSNIGGIGIATYQLTNFNLSNNTFSKIGLFPEIGNTGDGNLLGIRIWGGINGLIKKNNFDSIGYCGILFRGSNILTEENYVSRAMLITNDGGGIYSYKNTTFNNTYKKNIITNINGNITARPSGSSKYIYALYMDWDVSNVILSENTIYNVDGDGIRISTLNHDILIEKNTTYKCKTGVCFRDADPGASVYNMKMKYNIFYSNYNNSSIPVMLRSDDNNFTMLSSSDSNYYCNPYSTKVVEYSWSSTQTFNMNQWRTTSNFDANSKNSYYQWPFPTDNSFILVNHSDTSVTHSFSNTVNLDNNIVNSITLLPYTSKVLIGGNITTNLSPINEELQLHVFPNPSHDFINYESNDVISQVIIYDSYGRLVQQFKNQQSGEIDIRNLDRGIYYVELMSENKIYRNKVIKQ